MNSAPPESSNSPLPVAATPPKKKRRMKKTSSGGHDVESAERRSSKKSSTPSFSSILKGSAKKSKAPPHDHAFKRVIVEASVVLEQAAERDRYQEFNHSISVILKNGVFLDEHFELNPIARSSKLESWKLPKDVPSNMTAFGLYISINTPTWKFKSKGSKTSDNTIYFSFTISSDTCPEDLCRNMIMEWNRQNGDRLAVKAVQSHVTHSVIMFFRLWNEAPVDCLLAELK